MRNVRLEIASAHDVTIAAELFLLHFSSWVLHAIEITFVQHFNKYCIFSKGVDAQGRPVAGGQIAQFGEG